MSTITLAEYLFSRLVQLGCKSLHGLPGDFNLLLLDYVDPSGLKWVGNCNELNAAYAADAYARINGIGAICTTFGVGELSALNGIAGSYSELAPVVHIVGTPGRPSQEQGMLLHHTLGNGDFRVFARIAKEVTIAQADLQDPKTAPKQIDDVLRRCYVESRPVYIQLPTDMVKAQVSSSGLQRPIDVSPLQSDPEAEDLAVQIVLEKIYAAKRPVFLIDGACQRRRVTSEVNTLVRKAGLPIFVAPMGKGIVDENLPSFVGLYAGAGSFPDVAAALESSDLVITLGNIQSDLNTAGFTYHFSRLNRIDIHYNHIDVNYATFSKVYWNSSIPKIEQRLDTSRLAPSAKEVPLLPARLQVDENDETITHKYLWPKLSEFLENGDVLVTETGTSYVGYWETKLPPSTTIINQILWSSIGYGVGATQGAALALQDLKKNSRTICFEGDGSFQLTAQELSTIIRHDLNVIMFVIENEGYEIERWVHGMNAAYNDVVQWKYSDVPEALNDRRSSKKIKTYRISTRNELEQLFADKELANGSGLRFVEMHMPKGDAPKTLKDFGTNAAERSS